MIYIYKQTIYHTVIKRSQAKSKGIFQLLLENQILQKVLKCPCKGLQKSRSEVER